MRNIVVTTDLSDNSKLAFPIAKDIARSQGASLHLVAVMENPLQTAMIYSMDFPVFPDPELEKQLRQKLSSQLEQIKNEEFAGLQVTANLVEASGPISSEIIKYAQSAAADLIVIATHGRSGISRLLIGSVAERVVRESCCPVLAVPTGKLSKPTAA